uniref:Uncharacterized protein n=1 Tax=Corallina officinalis TaxID=35170 RepID=A0A6M3WDB4_COROI|nr:hypothetical protein [Corallina officinalis]QJF58498.1 hypothetical protein [Corallina officinalis]QJF58697.1 hypothetical protein [Corallina officinalis]QJF58896.1 hypothetical protein [Corallina officinalis]
MEITNLRQKYLFISPYLLNVSSFLIKLDQLGQIWLFNCSEGCQHTLAKKKVKISQITKIIITELSIQNISGLLGLLSSLSLNTQINKIDIYGPKGLDHYLFLGRKYSQTNFRYKLSIHVISTGLIASSDFFKLYASINQVYSPCFDYYVIIQETPGRFNLIEATRYKIPLGPLYGQLKKGSDFILPDGYTVYGYNFIQSYNLGIKIAFLCNEGKRSNIECAKFSTYLFYI